jgi:hypothetical protein
VFSAELKVKYAFYVLILVKFILILGYFGQIYPNLGIFRLFYMQFGEISAKMSNLHPISLSA